MRGRGFSSLGARRGRTRLSRYAAKSKSAKLAYSKQNLLKNVGRGFVDVVRLATGG